MARLNSSTNESSPAENADNSNLSDSSKAVPDSETLDLQCDDCSRDCDTEVETPAWALNPGEVEDEEERSLPMVTQSISMMEFSTKVASPVDSSEAVELGSADDAQVMARMGGGGGGGCAMRHLELSVSGLGTPDPSQMAFLTETNPSIPLEKLPSERSI